MGCQAVLSSSSASSRRRESSLRLRAGADPQHALDRLGGEHVQPLAERRVAARVDDRVEVAVGAERGRELVAAAREQVHDAAGDVGDGQHLAEVQPGQRPALRADRHDGVAGRPARARSRRRGRAARAPRARRRRPRRSARASRRTGTAPRRGSRRRAPRAACPSSPRSGRARRRPPRPRRAPRRAWRRAGRPPAGRAPRCATRAPPRRGRAPARGCRRSCPPSPAGPCARP